MSIFSKKTRKCSNSFRDIHKDNVILLSVKVEITFHVKRLGEILAKTFTKLKTKFNITPKLLLMAFGFWFWEWIPSIGGKVGIPRGILPHVQTGLTNWESR